MPELQKYLITGGGIAGMAAAIWAARQNPRASILLLEKGPVLAGWLGASSGKPLLLGTLMGTGRDPAGFYPRGSGPMERILPKWPGEACRDWLKAGGVPLETDESGGFSAPEGFDLPGHFGKLLSEAGVEVRTAYAVETIHPRPGGGFRVWSREGDPVEGDCLVMATGGERNHGLRLARELGTGTLTPFAAYLRLRSASQKLAERLGSMERPVRLRCVKTGEQATGWLEFSGRGLEGPALSDLSARLCETWGQMNHRFLLEVDWLPETGGATVRNELDSRCRRGTRRSIGAEPLFGFTERQWLSFLNSVRVDPGLAWPRLKSKKLQALVQRLKGDQLSIDGMGLPAGERAWAGGVQADAYDWESMESLRTRGLYFAGEILDILGLPGGPHLNMAWATGYVAGSAMALSGPP